MEMKVTFDEKSLQQEGLRATILKGAVDHLLQSLTPELLRTFMEKVLEDAFKNISSYDLSNAVRPYVNAVAKEYMDSPEMQERTRTATRAAVDAALGKLPGEITSDIAEMARKEFRRAVESKLGR